MNRPVPTDTHSAFHRLTPDMVLGQCLERPSVQAQLTALLAAAEQAAAGDEMVLRRVRRDRDYFAWCWEGTYREYLAKRPKTTQAGKRTGPIAVDGVFAEPDWARLDFTGNFIVNDGTTVAAPQTYVKALYDADNLYFAVEAMEPQSDRLAAACTTRDGPRIWDDTTLEFFIAIPGMNGQYYHLAVTPKGTLYDALVAPSQAADLRFDSRAEIRTAVLPDRWTVELRLPAAALGRALRDGETWKVNVGRNRKLGDGTKPQASSWSNGAFHGPDAYRPLLFGDAALLRNGDFEESRAPNRHETAYFEKTAWTVRGDRVPDQWTFNGDHGTAALVTGGAASGRQFLRLSGAIYSGIQQPADYRGDLLVRAKARGKGSLAVYLYRYRRADDKHESSVILREVKLDTDQWTAVQAAYECNDDRILRLAFHVAGEVDVDDVGVTQEPPAAPAPAP